MLTAIGTWFAKEGVGLLLGALSKLALDAWDSYQSKKSLQDLGRVTAERDQQAATAQATQRELDAAVKAPKTTDDAIKRLEEGSA